MALTPLQKASCEAIVNVFETGRARGKYDQVTLLAGDTGQLTYGRSQTTLGSGNLYLLIKAYCAATGAAFGAALAKFVDRLALRDATLNNNLDLRGLLRQAGADPVMQATQDAFFDRVYWDPSLADATRAGLASALGAAVVYDSHIHGSWRLVYDKTVAAAGAPGKAGEKAWVSAYVSTRRDWLANHSNELLHRTVYRMEAFQGLIAESRWDLDLPFTVRGCRIDEQALGIAAVPVRASAADPDDIILRFQNPPISDNKRVRELQEALNRKVGAGTIEVDGSFGERTKEAVIAFQKSRGLGADGVVGPVTWAALRA